MSFEVQDTGVGIDSEQSPKVFEMFSQVSKTLERAEGGLGIGLAVAKALVEMHGGKITAASGGAGKGSTFRAVIPHGETFLPAPTPVEARFATPSNGSDIVVIADDNLDAAESLAAVLELDAYANAPGQ